MRVAVQRWGNSLAVRIPRGLAAEMGLERGGQLDIRVEDGRLVAAPVVGRTLATPYRLEDLLASIGADTLHTETDWGGPVGAEAW